jgi:hypothetical protein
VWSSFSSRHDEVPGFYGREVGIISSGKAGALFSAYQGAFIDIAARLAISETFGGRFYGGFLEVFSEDFRRKTRILE